MIMNLGSIPLRHLVYGVYDLPPSMSSLIFDFGRLDNDTEKKYIEKIVENRVILSFLKNSILYNYNIALCH